PFYVSTVDSGNLAGDLIVLRQACDAADLDPIFGPASSGGLRDAMLALQAALGANGNVLAPALEEVERRLGITPRSVVGWQAWQADIGRAVRALDQRSRSLAADDAAEARAWCGKLVRAVEELDRDLESLLPWARVIATQPPPFGDGRPLDGDLRGRPYVFADL